jgi:hypothetical protein
MSTVVYHLWGRVHPKKNSQQIVMGGFRPHIIPSKQYEAFKEQSLWELKIQKSVPSFKPYYIHLTIETKRGEWADPDNMECAINDILQAAGIIGNDRDNLHVLRDVIPQKTKWYTTIEFMDKESWSKLKLRP